METKGNKNADTIRLEEQFKSIIKARGGDYLHEFTIYQTPEESYQSPRRKRIDFVVGMPSEKGNILVYSSTGVELKTSVVDLIGSAYGKNFACFQYNYLLVPEEICVRAFKYMQGIVEYNHVGILVLCDNGELHVIKRATMYKDDVDFDIRYKEVLAEDNEPGMDSVWFFLDGGSNTAEEIERLQADAYAHGMNVSEYVRWLIEKEREKERNS